MVVDQLLARAESPRHTNGKHACGVSGLVADNLDDVRAYMEEEGMDVEEMSDAELEEQSEVFALPDGQYLIVMG